MPVADRRDGITDEEAYVEAAFDLSYDIANWLECGAHFFQVRCYCCFVVAALVVAIAAVVAAAVAIVTAYYDVVASVAAHSRFAFCTTNMKCCGPRASAWT